MAEPSVDVLLVTERRWSDGEPGAPALDDALGAAGISFRWVVWDDPEVDWADARLIAVRSTWDYMDRLDEFLAWSRGLPTPLLNGADVFAWNTDKDYLVELGAAGVPVVPTVSVDAAGDLVAAAASFEGRVVVKPRVGAGGLGIVVVTDPDDLADAEVGPGPWAVQPVIESVRTEGEVSVFVLGGAAVSQVRKRPTGEEIRVHEHFGGETVVVPLDDAAAELALHCVRTAEGLLGTPLAYARVDQMWHEGRPVVSELEATEPGLYLDVLPGNATPFVALVREVLDGQK